MIKSMGKKIRNLGILHKLIIYLVICSVIPLMFFGLISYNSTKTMMTDEIEKASLQMMASKLIHLEVILDEVETLIQNLSGIDDIKNVIASDDENIDDYDRLATQAQIGYILSGFTNLNGLISIDIYSKNGAHYHVGDTLDVKHVNLPLKDALFTAAINSDEAIFWSGIEENINLSSTHKKVIVAEKVLRRMDEASGIEKPIGIIFINYDIDIFYDHFSSIENTNTDYLILDRKNRIVYSRNKDIIGEQINGAILDKMVDTTGKTYAKIDGSESIINYNNESKQKFTLVGITPLKSIASKINGITLNAALILLSSFLIVIFGTIIFSKQFINPIRKITNYFKEIQRGTLDYNTRLKVTSSDEMGDLVLWFNTFIESQQYKQAADKELQFAKQLAETANISKSQFLANMSHEIRTPINGILGFLDLMGKTDLNPAQQDYLSEAKSASEVLLYLINDILDFSKIEAGRLSIENIEFNVYEAVYSAVSVLMPVAKEKNLPLNIQLDENIPKILIGDPTRLRQVLGNLISNAVKFTEKGSIDISVSVKQKNSDNVLINFRVKDTGMGINKETLDRLCQPFIQGDTSMTRKFGGTGLGLAITKELIRLMNGELRIDSTPGEGSEFSFDITLRTTSRENGTAIQLPLKPEDAHAGLNADKGKVKLADTLGSNLRILTVEDNPVNIKLIQKLLEREGFSCDVAMNGIEAVEAVKHEQYDIILMDCQMPVMDGFDATTKIRELEADKRYATIIAMTASAMEGDRERCLLAGMDDYISKPISTKLLFEKIENITK